MKTKKKQSIKESRKARMFQGKALEKRIKTSQQKSKGFRSNVFKDGKEFEQYNPKDGSHIIDVIPYLAGKNDPATEEGNPTYTFEYQIHRVGPNNVQYVCPAMYGKKCPVCEHRNKLREKDDDNYKKYWPKTRNLYNVISYDDKKETKKGVQVWDVANFYFEKPLMAISRKPSRSGEEEKTVNFVDPVNGKSITFSIEPAKSKDDFPKFVGHSFDDRDYEIDDEVLDKAYALDELVEVASYEDIKKAMYAEEDDDDSKDDDSKDDDEPNWEILIDELDEIDDMDDLVEFAEEYDLEVDEDGKIKKEKKKVRKQLEEKSAEQNVPDDDDDEEDEDIPTKKEIKKMKFKQLLKLIEEHGLNLESEDYEKDDIDDLKDDIIEELDL